MRHAKNSRPWFHSAEDSSASWHILEGRWSVRIARLASPIRLFAPSSALIGSQQPMSALPLDNTSLGSDVLEDPRTDTDPWQVCGDRAKGNIEDLCKSWREEIDNLLIFAGLFSAVVTAFAIESYHSVKEDPADTTVLLLRTIIHQLANMTDPQSGSPTDLEPSGKNIPPSAKRINTFWFLSLALSLSTVMAGILCLQWVREYSRNTSLPHREDVPLHYMRYEGIKEWQVPKILSALPLLLIGALLLFFTGFIEILWEVDKTAAILVAIVVGVAFIFALMTTILPTFQYIRICTSPSSESSQCPYKSPQSWIFFKIVAYFVYFFSQRTSKSDSKQSASGRLRKLSDAATIFSWLDYDRVLRKHRDAGRRYGARDVGRSLAWIGENFVQDQKVAEAIGLCLQDVDWQIALEASLARMDPVHADSVRRYVNSQQGRRPFIPEIANDLIVHYALEYLTQKMERAYISPKLVQQRVGLFLKICERIGVDHDVVCPVNHYTVNKIHRDMRERTLRYIHAMLLRNLDCNPSLTKGAFEIIRSIFVETASNGPLPPIVSDTLDELLEWIRREHTNWHSGERPEGGPEGRLRQAIPFHKLILVCKGEDDRRLVARYRQGLDDYIKVVFGQQLGELGPPMRHFQYPHLSRYVMSRGLD